jgi:D-alanyl-D-alanine carboxypeptidase (penicillin-binding protein 5/6)
VRYPGAIGGKTGFTDAARKTYVGAAERNGRRLVIAMMYGLVREGGPTYWDQAAMLLDWGFAQNPADSVAAL